MPNFDKMKEWISQNVPMLAKVYENKYVGMVYDRFASLPAAQQRQVILGTFAGAALFICLIVFISYLSLWSATDRTKNANIMITMLQQHQKNRRDQEQQLQVLERNNQLSGENALKDFLLKQGQAATISQRLVKVEEKPSEGGDEAKGSPESRSKSALVRLERINLHQLRNFLHNVEFGPYTLTIPSLKITNDDKIRGYMNAEITVTAFLLEATDEG